jgi:hypothetical protein
MIEASSRFLKMTKRCKFVVVSVIAVMIVGSLSCCVLPLFNPLRKPEEQIRASLLKETPPGTAYDKVKSYIVSQGWDHQSFIHPDPFLHPEEQGKDKTKSIMATLGSFGQLPWEHGFPFAVVVTAHWTFDARDALTDIGVSTYLDGF